MEGSAPLARTADGLTAARLVIGFGLSPAAWSGSWTITALLLSTAWLSDLLDGRLARKAGGGTRLGHLDLTVDTAVGLGLVIGLVGHGTLPIWLGLGAVALFGPLFIAGNPAAGMLLQLTGYLPVLAVLRLEQPPGWWLPFVVAIGIGIVDWRRLVLVNIPVFLRGITGRFERHTGPGPPV